MSKYDRDQLPMGYILGFELVIRAKKTSNQNAENQVESTIAINSFSGTREYPVKRISEDLLESSLRVQMALNHQPSLDNLMSPVELKNFPGVFLRTDITGTPVLLSFTPKFNPRSVATEIPNTFPLLGLGQLTGDWAVDVKEGMIYDHTINADEVPAKSYDNN